MERVLYCRAFRNSHLRLQGTMGWLCDIGRRPAQRPQHAQRSSSAISACKRAQRAQMDCLQQGAPSLARPPQILTQRGKDMPSRITAILTAMQIRNMSRVAVAIHTHSQT